jgi:hypothetical protein
MLLYLNLELLLYQLSHTSVQILGLYAGISLTDENPPSDDSYTPADGKYTFASSGP